MLRCCRLPLHYGPEKQRARIAAGPSPLSKGDDGLLGGLQAMLSDDRCRGRNTAASWRFDRVLRVYAALRLARKSAHDVGWSHLQPLLCWLTGLGFCPTMTKGALQAGLASTTTASFGNFGSGISNPTGCTTFVNGYFSPSTCQFTQYRSSWSGCSASQFRAPMK